MAGKEILSGLLTRQNQGSTGGTFKDIAADFFSGSSNDNKRRRNVMIGTALWGAKESSMQNNVMKNLQENETQRTFELAGLTQKWDKYNKLMTEDEAYKADPFYFRQQAESAFNKKNSNYFETYGVTESTRAKKKLEIDDYETALKNLHEKKLKGGNINERMTKEQFFKPFEDYYSNQQESIAAPKNISLIHNAWSKITGKGKETLTPKQQAAAKSMATRSVYDYLLTPDALTSDEQIEMYRDPKAFTYNKDEALVFLSQTVNPNDPARRNLISSLDTSKKTKWTKSELQTHIVNSQVDFNPIVEKNKVVSRAFDEEWSNRTTDGTSRKIPEVGTPQYMSYYLEKANAIDEANGTGDVKVRQLRRNIFELADLDKIIDNSGKGKEHSMYQVKVKLENDIRNAGIDSVKYEMYKIVTARFDDYEVEKRIKNKIFEFADPKNIKQGKTFEYKDMGEYYTSAINQLMSNFNTVFKEEESE